jgi:hypothetical protein
MDPNATLKNLLDACDKGNRDEALGAVADLVQWFGKGGFLPTVDRQDDAYTIGKSRTPDNLHGTCPACRKVGLLYHACPTCHGFWFA